LKLILILRGEKSPIVGMSIYTKIFQSTRIRIKLPVWSLKTTSQNYNKASNKRKMLQKSLEKYLDMLIAAIKEYQLWNVISIQIKQQNMEPF
jgi:hypothetical protein